MNDAPTPRLGSGSIPIVLNGTEYELKPTIAAWRTLSRYKGGLRGVIDALLTMDADTAVRVVEVGLGPTVAKQVEHLEDAVFLAGMTDDTGGIISKCVNYVMVLGRGGRPLEEDPVGGADDRPTT